MKERVTQRFLKYVAVDTQSDEASDTFPSTEKQKVLAKMLVEELRRMGVPQVEIDEQYGYVYAKILSNRPDGEKVPVLGFIAHMDTSPEVSGADVKPQIIRQYDGKDIVLNKDKNIVLSVEEFPELVQYTGQTLITTDGTTLLGADDKAGVAEIMTMAEQLCSHPEIVHGDIAIAFTPDEEVGGGMDHFDVGRFGADYAYTVDGGALGELEYENFNAAKTVIHVTGRSVHPGDAKDKMKNAAVMAMEFHSELPKQACPERTSGYEGFFHLDGIAGDVEETVMDYIIRDHDNGHTFLIQTVKKLHDLSAGLGIQCSRRLISQQNLRIVHHSTGNGYTLFLTTGQLRWFEFHTICQPHTIQCSSRTFFPIRLLYSCINQRQCYIFQCALSGQQMKTLKHKPDTVQSDICKFPVFAL